MKMKMNSDYPKTSRRGKLKTPTPFPTCRHSRRYHKETRTDMEPNTQSGGTYLKHGTLLAEWQGEIDNRPAGKNRLDPGAFLKASEKYGNAYEIPITVSEIPFVVSVPEKSSDAQAIVAKLGSDPKKWTGQRIRVYNDPVLAKVRVKPL